MILFFIMFAEFSIIPVMVIALAAGIVFYFIIVVVNNTIEKDAPLPCKIKKAIECLTVQAVKHSGVMKEGVSARKPIMVFVFDETEFSVSIDEGSKGNPSVTFATFQSTFFADKNFRLASKEFKAVFSFSRIKTIVSRLSPEFGFEGNDANFIKKVLTPEVESDLLKFGKATEVRFGNHTGVKYSHKSNPSRLYICVDGIESEDAGYDRLIETTLAIYMRLKAMTSEIYWN